MNVVYVLLQVDYESDKILGVWRDPDHAAAFCEDKEGAWKSEWDRQDAQWYRHGSLFDYAIERHEVRE